MSDRNGGSPEPGEAQEAVAEPGTGTNRSPGEIPDPADDRHADPGDPESSRDALVRELQRTILISSRRLRRRTADETVSAAQFSVLAYLERHGESTPGRVAEFEQVSAPVMTRMVGRLEEAGLVLRGVHPGDRRQVAVRLTSLGQDVVASGRRERYAWLRTAIDGLDADEVRILREAARILDTVVADGPE